MNTVQTQPATPAHDVQLECAATHFDPVQACVASHRSQGRVQLGRAPKQPLRHRDVREAVASPKRRTVVPHELPTAEACLAALKLGWHPVELKGDKIAMVLEGRAGVVHGVAICARPCNAKLDDGLSVELRCLVATDCSARVMQQLGRALARAAIRRGYRRLLVRNAGEGERLGLEGSWVPVQASASAFTRLANVLRGDGFNCY